VASVSLRDFPPKELGFWLGFFLLIYLAVVLIIDLEHRLVLHPVSYFGVALGVAGGNPNFTVLLMRFLAALLVSALC